MINSISSIQEVIKKTVKALYNKGSLEEKKEIYKDLIPIAKHAGMIIFPPWVFATSIATQNFLSMMKILF
jgi:hypothetical protein